MITKKLFTIVFERNGNYNFLSYTLIKYKIYNFTLSAILSQIIWADHSKINTSILQSAEAI